MKPEQLHIDRLPIGYRPPFDCVNDNATCPACKKRRDDHGVCGSIVDFAVRADHEGKRYAVSLRVFGGDYLPITRQWWRSKGLDFWRAAFSFAENRARDDSVRMLVVDGQFRGTVISLVGVGFLAAEALFNAHGDRLAADVRDQPETLWIALERCLVDAIFGTAGGAS